MAIASIATPARWRVEILALQIVVAIFLGLRLYANLNMDLLGDEAYYWMWGQHLSWSYFDHPPLHAWLLRIVEMVFGWHNFSLRILTWLTLGGTLAIFWAWAKRLSPGDPQLWFWRGTAIYLASPMYFGLTTVAYHDHLVVFLMLLAAHLFMLFVDGYEKGIRGALRWLFAAAVAVGLAALAKYSAVFLALGFGLTFLLRAKLRPLLLTPYPWLAALVALALQTPVIWWNLVESGASFRYHFNDRWGGDVGSLHWMNVLIFVAQTLLFGSPFLVWPFIRVLASRPSESFASAAKTLAASTFVISTLAMLIASLFMNAYFYWNIPGFAVMMLLMAGAMKSAWLRAAHLIYGLFWASAIILNFTIVPIGTLLQRQDNGASINYDWPVITEQVEAARGPADFVGATHYSTASQLGFQLRATDVVKLSAAPSQYDYWQDLTQLAGRSAVILVDLDDEVSVMDYLNTHFTTLTQIDQFNVTRFDRYLYAWRIFRGEGFKP